MFHWSKQDTEHPPFKSWEWTLLRIRQPTLLNISCQYGWKSPFVLVFYLRFLCKEKTKKKKKGEFKEPLHVRVPNTHFQYLRTFDTLHSRDFAASTLSLKRHYLCLEPVCLPTKVDPKILGLHHHETLTAKFSPSLSLLLLLRLWGPGASF